jgi:hypothetical protein
LAVLNQAFKELAETKKKMGDEGRRKAEEGRKLLYSAEKHLLNGFFCSIEKPFSLVID